MQIEVIEPVLFVAMSLLCHTHSFILLGSDLNHFAMAASKLHDQTLGPINVLFVSIQSGLLFPFKTRAFGIHSEVASYWQ